MTKVFFTYVWGSPGEPAWPLTFASKASRTHARSVLSEGDLVFTVGTKGDPTPPEHHGRVVGAFQVSDLEVNTADYDLPLQVRSEEFDSVKRFPFALHPIAVWEISTSQNFFSTLVGPLTPAHHLWAQSRVVELDAASAASLLALPRREVVPALPKTEFGRGRVLQKNSRLAPKHEGQYLATFGEHETWFVYTLILRDKRNRPLAVKVGYSNEPQTRVAVHNGPMASEVTGLIWGLDAQQPVSTEEAARSVEQAVLKRFAKNRLPSNGEILMDVDSCLVAAAIATELRSLAI